MGGGHYSNYTQGDDRSSSNYQQNLEGTIKRSDKFIMNGDDGDSYESGTPRIQRTLEGFDEQINVYRMTDIKKQIDQQNAINDLGSFAFNPNNMNMKVNSSKKLTEIQN